MCIHLAFTGLTSTLTRVKFYVNPAAQPGGFIGNGFHWYRPVIDGRHRVFLPMDDTKVTGSPPSWRWNKANVQSVGGGFTIHSDASATVRLIMP